MTRMPTPREIFMRQKTYSIAALAEEFAISARALRFYEEKGLLTPFRQGLERLYTKQDRARLKLILRCKRWGFTLTEIRDLLEAQDETGQGETCQGETGAGAGRQLRLSLQLGREKLAALQKQRVDIESGIAELQATMADLERQLRARDSNTRDTNTARLTVLRPVADEAAAAA